MGEIADMMLDGTLCEQCGVYLGEDNFFPTTCAGCEVANGRKEKEVSKKISKKEKDKALHKKAQARAAKARRTGWHSDAFRIIVL